MSIKYEVKDLKRAQPGLNSLNHDVCLPVFSVVASRFLEDLSSNFEKYCIDRCDCLSEFDENRDAKDVFVVMAGVMMIKIIFCRANIYIKNCGLAWYLPSSITFDAGDAGGFAEDLYQKFVDFVKKQNLVSLKKEASFVLKKGRAKSLQPGIVEFYLE